MDEPRLEWTVTAAAPPLLAAMNAIGSAMPLASWGSTALLRLRERAARAFGLGEIALAGAMPSGHSGVLMPERMYLVTASTAIWEGTDLGRPTRLAQNPTIGEVPLPARGVVAIGQAMWGTRHPDDVISTRTALAEETPLTPGA